jgi:hypothetical protein
MKVLNEVRQADKSIVIDEISVCHTKREKEIGKEKSENFYRSC